MAKMTEALGVENIESLDRNDYMEFRNELKANGSLSSKFDDEFFNSVYPGRGYKDYVASVDEDLGKIIEDAKAGNEYAECYLIIAARKLQLFEYHADRPRHETRHPFGDARP